MVKLITLNCYLWPYGARHSLEDPQKSQRWQYIKKMIAQNKNTIICLQEFYSSWWDNTYKRDLLESFSTRSIIFGGSADWGFDSGLVIISPFPIIKHSFVKFQNNPGIMSWANRGFLAATIIYKDEQYQIINTHLHPPEASIFTSKDTTQKIRKKQINQIRSFYGTKKTILIGDFNTTPNSLPYIPNSLIVNPDEPTVHFNKRFCSHKIYCECDFAILINFTTMYKVQILESTLSNHQKILSDHWPVFIRLF
jgi:endonuclease/exonuclease/phosphatase family metal-dependent hydrolase